MGVAPPTSLRNILPPSFPPFYLPSNIIWRHPRVFHPTLDAAEVADLMSTQPLDLTDILVYPIPHPSLKASAFLITQDGLVIDRGFCLGPDTVTTAITASVDAIQAVPRFAPSHIRLFVHNEHACRRLFSLRKQKYLPEASRFTAILSTLLMADDSSFTTHSFKVRLPGKKSKADPRVFPHNWPGPPQKNWNLAELRASAAEAHHSLPPPITPKQHAFASWAHDPGTLPICKWTQEALQVPPDPTPADLVLGALKLKQRRVFCACLQAFFQHCFSGSFSLRFRPTAGDTITCPCGDPPTSHLDVPTICGTVAPEALSTPVVGPNTDIQIPVENGPACRSARTAITPLDGSEGWHADPSPGFRRLMEEFLDPDGGREADTPPPVRPRHMGQVASAHLGPLRKIHSPEYVLLECPLTEPFRHLIRDSVLGTVNVRNLFYTIKGAEALATFLLRSNSLLRPLPPRPDPP